MAEGAAASGGDQISALPLDVRLLLLSFLPVNEAVRCSELSRGWRGLWKNMPSLRLVGSEEQFKTADDFNQFVNHLIVLRGHLPLDEFQIEFRESEVFSPYPYANLWIEYALIICKVRLLDVSGDANAGFGEFLELSVPLVSERLTTLNLSGVHWENRSALVDSNLSLDFSSCPLLKSLSMEHCNICVGKVSSKSLKRLSISFSRFNSCPRPRTWISAPKLISLELYGYIGEAPVLENMPFLQRALIELSEEEQSSCNAMNPGDQSVLKGVSNATHLELIADPKVYIYRRDLACCPIFGNLKTLILDEWCVTNSPRGLVCILQHSPILEKLTLNFDNTKGLWNEIGDDGNHDPIETTFACSHLKEVEIKCEVMNESVSKTLKLLSTNGIPPEHITLKVNQSNPSSFSLEMPRDTTTLS